jgi:hypothetical protein
LDHIGDWFFPAALPGLSRSGLKRDPVGDAIEPRADRIARPHISGPAGEHQKRCLERILRILVVA